MEIKGITLGGFRNIKDCHFDIENIISFLSVNSYGKSNLLKAIEFGIDFIVSSKKTKNDMIGWKKGFPKNKHNLASKFMFELILEHDYNDSKYEIKYGYSLQWRKNEDEPAGVDDEYLLVKEKSKNQKFSHYIKRNKEKNYTGFYKTSSNGRCDKSINVEYDELILNKLASFDELFYYNIISAINSLEVYIDKHLDSFDAYQLDPIVRKDSDDLKLVTADNIPRTLYKLKEHHEDKYNYLMDIYKQLFPKIEDITIREFRLSSDDNKLNLPDDYQFIDRIHMLYCKEYNMIGSINFTEMSDGARRILLLLTNLILADLNNISLFCIEEPENSINPSLLGKYIEIINDLTENTKVIITSHSPYLVDYMDPEKIYIGYNNREDIATFKKIKTSAVKKLFKNSAGLNMNYGEYLFDLFTDFDSEVDEYLE